MCGIIYKVINLINNKIYIGLTKQKLKDRIRLHYNKCRDLTNKTHFICALRKYKKEDFIWEIIDKGDSLEELNDLEYHYIKQYNSYLNGYNSTLGGDGTVGVKLYGKNNPFYGKKHSKETTEKIKNSLLGKSLSEFHKQKIKEGMKFSKRNNKDAGKNISKGMLNSPKNGKFYLLKYDNGNKEKIKNLRKWCRENKIDTQYKNIKQIKKNGKYIKELNVKIFKMEE